MNPEIRTAEKHDLDFLRRMLYEAVFWRRIKTPPPLEEALQLPEVAMALEAWGEREGDLGIVAWVGGVPVGAAWVRFWSEDLQIRGYCDPQAPVLVIGVDSAWRGRGIGTRMMEALLKQAADRGITRISLAVSKDNPAMELYPKTGFVQHIDKGDWLVMVKEI